MKRFLLVLSVLYVLLFSTNPTSPSFKQPVYSYLFLGFYSLMVYHTIKNEKSETFLDI